MNFFKKHKSLYWWTIITFLVMTFTACHSNTEKKSVKNNFYYTCSMHSQIHEDKPGDCPICGMKLIKVETTQTKDTTSIDTSLAYLTVPVTESVVGSFKVIEPAKSIPSDTIIADGMIGFDQRDINTVSSRISGRIDNLYVKYSGQSIQKGQALMRIYSPQLLSVQRDLLQTIQDNDATLSAALKNKLLNLGMRESEIQEVINTKKLNAEITIYSPYSGISMPTNSAAVNSNMPQQIEATLGMYVNAGQTVFNIQNINRSWAMLNIFNDDVEYIHVGNIVQLFSDGNEDKPIIGRIDFIPPNRIGNDKTTSVRVYVDHLPRTWKIGTLVHASIAIAKEQANISVPLSAVNKLGERTVVWVQDKNHTNVFHVRTIKTGLQTNDKIEILSGINAGDKIVENAAYMVDSDSFIQ